MTPAVPIAAFYLVILVRALVPATSVLHARRPLGCSTCMAGWSALALVLLVAPPCSWLALRWFPVWWFASAAPVWAALEALERLPSPPPPADLLPPDPPQT